VDLLLSADPIYDIAVLPPSGVTIGYTRVARAKEFADNLGSGHHFGLIYLFGFTRAVFHKEHEAGFWALFGILI